MRATRVRPTRETNGVVHVCYCTSNLGHATCEQANSCHWADRLSQDCAEIAASSH